MQDASFVESRLHSLRTRGAAAYKGIYALILGNGARDWRFNVALDKTQYSTLAIDVHHVFPQKWCRDHDIEDEYRESIVNKSPLAARTNRIIGGVAPSKYLPVIEQDAQLTPAELDDIVRAHLITPATLRADDFDEYFAQRRNALVGLVERAMGETVQRDVEAGQPEEDTEQFDPADAAVVPDQAAEGDPITP